MSALKCHKHDAEGLNGEGNDECREVPSGHSAWDENADEQGDTKQETAGELNEEEKEERRAVTSLAFGTIVSGTLWRSG